jgi:MFS transporter, DHA1 family, multidrug resistance protein
MQTSSGVTVSPVRTFYRERLALLIGFGLGSLAWNFCWPFLPLRVEAVGVTDLGEIARISGLLAGATNFITAMLGPLWIILGERFGYKYQVMRAHLGTAVSMSAIGLARLPLQLAGAATMLGTFGGNYPHYLAIAASRTSPAEVGQVVGDLQAAGQIGSTIGPLIGGLIASQLGLTASFTFSSFVSFSALLVVFLTVRPDRPKAGERSATRGSLRLALARPEHRWLMVVFLVGDAGIQGLRPLIPVIISQRVSDPATVVTTTGITATLAMAGTVVSALAVGRLSARVAPAVILRITLPIASISAATIPFAQGTLPLLAAWAFLGLAAGATTPAVFAWLGRLSPGSSGAFALLATVNMLDFAIGPAIMGQASIYGLDWPFRLAALSTAGAAIFVLFTRPRQALSDR